MKNLFLFFSCLFLLACNDGADWETKLKEAENKLADAHAKLESAEAALSNEPGLIHSVFFWLKNDLSETDEAAFLGGLESLKAVPTVKSCYIGPPAPTEARGVVDNTFSYALIVHFDGVAGQDAYQVDPIHLKFVEDQQDKWTKVIVYDNTMEE